MDARLMLARGGAGMEEVVEEAPLMMEERTIALEGECIT